MNLKDKKLAVLFTRKISLKIWDKVGNLEREILPYKKMSNHFKEIFLFTYGDYSDLQYKNMLPENIKIFPKPKFFPSSFYVFLMPIVYARIFRQSDIIKTNQMDGSWAGIIVKKLFNKKFVARSGYEWLNFLIGTKASFWKILAAKTVEKKTYKNSDAVIITSNEDRDFIKNTFGLKDKKVSVVRNYIDIEKFKQNPSENKIKNSILFVGRLEKDKNLNLLVEALKGLGCELFLVGDGSQKEEIKNLAKNEGVKINFLGRIPQADLPKILTQSEIFVLPSKSEGNPKALLEAMAAGLSCVGTNVKGIREVINDGENGLLSEVSPSSLREKIKILLDNKELRDRLGAEARKKIEKEYSLDVVLEKEIEIYKKLYE